MSTDKYLNLKTIHYSCVYIRFENIQSKHNRLFLKETAACFEKKKCVVFIRLITKRNKNSQLHRLEMSKPCSCEKNEGFQNVIVGGTYTYHWYVHS